MKCLIYCTMGKPYLKKCNHFMALSNRKIGNEGIELNGKVVARFWCDKVDKLEVEFYKNEPLYDENSGYQAIKRVCLEQLEYVDFDEELCDRETLYTNEIFEHEEKNNRFLKATCLTGKQLQNYFDGCDVGYAIHISKLEVFDKPLTIEALYQPIDNRFCKECKEHNTCIYAKLKGKPCKKVLLQAPQNMMYVWYKGEKYCLISIRPEWVCKIANGEKKIEVRRKVLKEMLEK